MASKILMPSGGQTTDEMVILKWYKQVGDPISRGDILFEIETDKAILTVESYAAGTLLEIKYPEGVMVKTGEVVAVIGDVNEKKETPVIKQAPVVDTNKAISLTTDKKEATLTVSTAVAPALVKNGRRVLASPLAKSLARIEQVKIEDVAKYVSKQLVKKADVHLYLENKKTVTPAIDSDDIYFINTSSIRKTIARRMMESVSTSPHYVISTDIDATAMIRLRKKLNLQVSGNDGKISYNDILMKVLAKAIESHPLINASFEGDQIRINRNVNVGLAIAVEDGIVVPVVKEVNKKSLAEIALVSSQQIDKVKTNKLLPADLTSGTITLSNLGMFGIDHFTAIINQPESCIIAAGAIIKKAVVVEDQVVVREMINITGSFDHRVVDGAVGAAFLRKVKSMLEDPELLLF